MTELSDDQVDQLLNNSDVPGKTVRLQEAQWGEILGLLTQGSQLMLSQLALQQNGLRDVAQLSVKADNLVEEIKRQLVQE